MPTFSQALITRHDKPFHSLTVVYPIVLLSRIRRKKVLFVFNRLTNTRASGSQVNHLPSYLVSNFGPGAVGILVGSTVYKNDEDMMRDALIEAGKEYFVLYEDYTPSYTESLSCPPIYHNNTAICLPGYNDDLVKGYLRCAYFEELVYYPQIPSCKKKFSVRMSFGRKAEIELSNYDTSATDVFKHELNLKVGFKATGIVDAQGRVWKDDSVLFADEIQEGGSYKAYYGSEAAVKVADVVPKITTQTHSVAHLAIDRPAGAHLGSTTTRDNHVDQMLGRVSSDGLRRILSSSSRDGDRSRVHEPRPVRRKYLFRSISGISSGAR